VRLAPVDEGVEGLGGAHQGLDEEGVEVEGKAEQPLRLGDGVGGDAGQHGRAVDEREAFLCLQGGGFLYFKIKINHNKIFCEFNWAPTGATGWTGTEKVGARKEFNGSQAHG
jgi:hypothetical protein